MRLETLRPKPGWDPSAYEESIAVLAEHRDDLTYRVWGGDWCKDCRRLLPDFGAALDAAGVPDERIEANPVDGDKQGPGVEEYGIEYIPTIVVENDEGTEVARFVEDEPVPPAVWLAEAIESAADPA